MSGRYGFSLPDPRQRDGWFRIGTFDMTTTALIVAAGLVSMFLYAINPVIVGKGIFVTDLVQNGEVWRTLTWPLMNPPVDIGILIGLVVFWFLGHMVEDDLGRVPYTWIVLAMTVIPAVIVTLTGVVNHDNLGRWSTASFSVELLSLGMISMFGIEHPNVKFFFGIPAWVIAAAFVFIEVLRDVGHRAWAQLLLVLLVIAVGCIGARQRGWLDHVTFIPRIRRLGPGGSSNADAGRVSRGSSSRRTKAPKRRSGSGPTVVAGPWTGGGTGGTGGGITPLEQAELDVLLDKIGAGGVDSLTAFEKARLHELSQRMRDS